MATRIVEGKKPYTGGKAIEIDENKVISLRLREENNLIIRDEGDNEIYVDLQLPDGITPLDAFPVGITVGRVLIADDWDVTGTLACFKTTSGDNIKLLYGDNGKVYIDNGTGLFKQIYLKGEVDALLQALRDYVDAQLALKQDKLIAGDYIEINENVISAVIPTMSRFLSIWNASSGEPISFPASTPFLYTTGDYYLIEGVGVSDNYRPAPIEYDGSASTIPETEEVADGDVYIYDGAVWLLQSNHGKTVTFQNIAGDPYDNTNLATALGDKQNTLISGTNIKSINNQSLLGNGDLSIAEVPSGGTNGQVLTQTSQGPSWQNATGGAEIVYATQTEYNNLPSSKLTDGKHYVIYTADSPTPPSPRQPGANTLAYYEFDNNLNDSSGNGHDLSVNAGTVTYGTDASGGKYVYFNQSTWTNQDTGIQYDVGNTTLLYWWQPKQIFSTGNYVSIWYANTLGNTISTTVRSLEVWDMSPGYSAQVDTWYLVAVVTGNGTRTYYVNGNVVATGSYSLSGTSSIIFTINNIGNLYQSQYANNNYISQLIIEDKSWTQQEIQDYYDLTKGDYGIS